MKLPVEYIDDVIDEQSWRAQRHWGNHAAFLVGAFALGVGLGYFWAYRVFVMGG